MRTTTLIQNNDSYVVKFYAMASPCEVIIQTNDFNLASTVGKIVSNEVWRIEDKFSRYNPKSLCSRINQSKGEPISIDEETYLLFNFAEQCYQLSDGLFDITSGILASLWSFNGKEVRHQDFPSSEQIDKVRALVGWTKVTYDVKSVTLPLGMALDFGGFGKEFAVDRSILLVKKLTDKPVLVNLGGDLAVTKSRENNQPWQVAIESLTCDMDEGQQMIIALKQGALATSGDTKRFLTYQGIRYGHIINAKTGWPIIDAPRSITTQAPQCIQAGILATLAFLQGPKAEVFLTEQEITYWATR